MRKGRVAARILLYIALGTASAGWGQTAYFGNQAVVNLANPTGITVPSFAFTDFPINTPTARADIRFTAQQSVPITEVQLYFPLITNIPPNTSYNLSLIVSVQTDSGGSPSGTLLGANTAFPALVGWDDIPLAAPSSVTAGTVYHLVVSWDKFSPANPPNAASFPTLRLSSQPDYYFYPQSGAPDGQLGTAEDPGTGAWTPLAEEPVFLVNYSGTWSGNPYCSVNSPGLGLGLTPGSYWETFSVPSTLTVDSVGTYTAALNRFSAPASLVWSLAASTASFGPFLAKGTLAVPGQLPATLAWVDVPMAPTTLVPGVNYTLAFSSSTAGSLPYFILDESPQVSSLAANFNVFETVSYGGAGSFEGNPAVLFCSLCPTTDYNYADDLPFRFAIVNAPTPTPTSTPAFAFGCQDTLFVSRNVYRPKTDNPALTLQTSLCEGGKYSVHLYNSAGEFIRSLRDNPNQSAGADQMTWDGKNTTGAYVASGIYIIYMTGPQSVHQAKLVVLE